MEWTEDEAIKTRLRDIVKQLEFEHIVLDRVHCYSTSGSKARAYARTWMFPKIFQKVLNVPPAYVIEVISEKFNRLSYQDQTRVLIHELLHIPKNFSGSLLPHTYGGGKKIHKEVDKLYKLLKN